MLTSPKYDGDPSVKALASGLATLGRYGDEYMVHAAHGETMIPPEVFEANPGLRDALFRQMQMMGIKDPDRFVVGNAMNSINPITGQPEFFFKKLWRGFKKIFKRIAPVLAPIVGNMIMPGLGGLIASGIVTKLQGGSWGDVLKGAAIGVGTQALMGGLRSMGPGGQGFGAGFGQGLRAPFQAGAGLFSGGASNPLNQGIFGTAGVYGTGLARGKPAGFFDYLAPSYNPNAQFAANLPAGVAARGGTTVVNPQNEISQIRYTTAGPDDIPSGGFEGSEATGILQTTPAQDATFFRHSGGDGDFLMDAGVNDLQQQANINKYGTGPNSFLARGELGPRLQRPGLSPQQQINLINQGKPLPAAGDWAPELRASEYPVGERIQWQGKTLEVMPGEFGGGIDAKGDLLLPNSAAARSAQKFAPVTEQGIFGGDWGIGKTAKGVLTPVVGEEWAGKAVDLGADYLLPAAAAAALYLVYDDDPEERPDEAAQPAEYRAYDDWRERIQQGEDPNSPGMQQIYFKWHGAPTTTRSKFERLTGGKSKKPDWMFIPEVAYDETGAGDMGYEGGGEVMGPGTGTSDSIPARLSDGEFVMTADAVRNAGGGNRNLGAARMYDMMRRFEGGTA
jgi:hypothetical protein